MTDITGGTTGGTTMEIPQPLEISQTLSKNQFIANTAAMIMAFNIQSDEKKYTKAAKAAYEQANTLAKVLLAANVITE